MPKVNKVRQGDLIVTSITEEQPEQEQDYYREQRGPIILVRGLQTEVKLSFVPNEDEDDENFACEHLEPFCATSRGIDKQSITLRNEGTTAIRCQWLRFPPNNESEFLLANPAGSVVPGGGGGGTRHGRAGWRKRLNDEKVFKSSCHQFRFRELPSVLLPGQSLEFTIVFRSKKPGYFFENLYLLTHPKLRDSEGRGYSLRLSGICMDPEIVETDGNKSRPENINELVSQTTLEQEAKDLMDSVLDHALFIEPEHPTTLPYLKVTSESIFYTHNRNLKYYYEISQKSLETVRRIIELLVPLQRIEKVCTLSIESLYQLLWTRNSSQDMYWTHFKTDKTEKLLKKLASYNNILIQPRRYSYCTADSRKITSSYATFVTLIDQILTRMEYIDALYSTRELQEIFIDISVQKYESRKLYDKEDNSVWDFGAFIPQMNEEIFEPSSKEETIGALEGETVQEIDSRQIQIQELVDRLVEISPSKKTVQEGKEKKRKNRKNDVAATLGKKWKKKSKQDKNAVDGMEEDEEGRLYGQQSAATVEMLGESSPLTRSAGSGSGGGTAEDSEAPTSTPPPPAVEEERSLATPISQRLEELPQAVQEQFQEETKRRIYQAKRMVFEDLLAKGIERIICAVDAFNAMEDYRQSEFLAKPNISTNYCCSD